MLIIKIELLSANTGKTTEIGRMHIVNNATGTYKHGNYDVEIMRRGTTNKVQRRGSVTDYPRQSYTVWELVRRALVAGLGKWPIHPGEPEEFDEIVKYAPAPGGRSQPVPESSGEWVDKLEKTIEEQFGKQE